LWLKEDTEYLVVGIDNNNSCPCIDIGFRYHFLDNYEMPQIELVTRKPISQETIDYIRNKFPYIAPSQEVDNLLIKLTNLISLR
jgi:hypothetical protein